MNIGIDARVLERKMTGIGRYLSDILNDLQSHKENDYYLFSPKEINFDNSSFIHIKTGKSNLPDKIFSPYWLNFVLPAFIEKNNIDLFFSPNHLLPRKKMNCKSVIVILDLLHLIDKAYHPFFYRQYLNFQLPHSIRTSNVIIAISESTKRDIVKYFNVESEKIKVIYPIPDKKFQPVLLQDSEYKRLKVKFNLPEKFILYVGVIENRKNITGILKIADILFSKHTDIKFVLAGKPGYGFNSIINEISKRKNVIYLSFIEEDDIVSIYNLANLFLFPSFYEGFGYPPLEAMQCGIPVLCSDIPPLKEVVGSNGFLRNPEDYNGFAEDILKLISNPKLYDEMKIRSISQARKFSGEESVNRLLDIFYSL